ncbi:hypothetical protein E1B28_012356 [Marasmius oreades]|uniref:Uncharacterized protein n=1 Tax=Marasmius oreades TaxID=181124 RepID=A0A9P7UN56_9AGAR|nr:uncharacterized protein E1B28_012356 [Marasmius oreades]KAG7088352.1 hypothetical protein E1B28_012356 [Marasmius oreades]
MADPAGMSPRSPAVRRSRDGSLNEYPPPHLSQPPYHLPSSSSSPNHSPHHQHHRLPSPHQPPQHISQLHAHATSQKRAATTPSKSSGPIDVGTSLPPPVPGPGRARPSEVSRGRSSTTSGRSDQGSLHRQWNH